MVLRHMCTSTTSSLAPRAIVSPFSASITIAASRKFQHKEQLQLRDGGADRHAGKRADRRVVYDFLWTQIHLLWKAYQKDTGESGRQKPLPARRADGLSRKAATKRGRRAGGSHRSKKTATEVTALVAAVERRVTSSCGSATPRLSRTAGRAHYADPSLFEAGKAEGKKLTLRKGVTEKQGNRTLLKPGS